MATAPLLSAMLEATARTDSGFEVNDRDHALQTATRARRAGADAELVVAALFHDAAKAVDGRRHGRLIAGLLAPHVRPEVEFVLRVHQDLTARHLDNGRSPSRRLLHRAHPAYPLAVRFVEEWDVPARDPDYPTEPLEQFRPLVEQVLAQRYPPRIPLRRQLRVVAGREARRAWSRLLAPTGARRPPGPTPSAPRGEDQGAR